MDLVAYAAILEPEVEGEYSVSVPAFAEIHTQGEDLDDALAMARDAIQLSLAVRRDEGNEIPASSFLRPELSLVSRLPQVRADRLCRALVRAGFVEVRPP